ncbi:MAG: hypothetical protein M1828_003020 [Chrysothrix sp. TS-e1954]|nr:MAG: hypothetical protein M1828_003020 [Chrysothrix sp. TS-e1954]
MASADAPLTTDTPPADQPAVPHSKLTTLTLQAAGYYAQKHYEQAADVYSEATALQAELNGELDPQNADLLYAYGRCLYHLAVGKSDVLGGKVAGDSGKPKGKKRKRAEPEKVAEKAAEKIVEGKDGKSDEQKLRDEKNPFLKIEGDDAEWDSDVEQDDDVDEEADGDAEQEEEEDDFANAFEILDLTRVLLGKQVEQFGHEHEADKANSDDAISTSKLRKAKELLADTHDLQSEISLENERFQDAVTDATSCLDLKTELYPFESSLVAEAHYKLSLALEFASVTSQKDPKDEQVLEAGEGSSKEPEKAKEENVDEAMRQAAAEHMKSAISSSKTRVEKEKAALPLLTDSDEKRKKEIELKDVEDIITDMEQRLEDLRNPATNVVGATGPADASDGSNALSGIIGSMLGASPSAQKARIEEATKNANDLTGMIRHKKTQDSEASSKRKAASEGERSNDSKRAKTEETPD